MKHCWRNFKIEVYLQSNHPAIKTIYSDFVEYYPDTENPDIATYCKMICSNQKLAAVFSYYLLEDIFQSKNSFDTANCKIYRISKPIDYFLNILQLARFSPFRTVFSHKYVDFYDTYPSRSDYKKLLCFNKYLKSYFFLLF